MVKQIGEREEEVRYISGSITLNRKQGSGGQVCWSDLFWLPRGYQPLALCGKHMGNRGVGAKMTPACTLTFSSGQGLKIALSVCERLCVSCTPSQILANCLKCLTRCGKHSKLWQVTGTPPPPTPTLGSVQFVWGIPIKPSWSCHRTVRQMLRHSLLLDQWWLDGCPFFFKSSMSGLCWLDTVHSHCRA